MSSNSLTLNFKCEICVGRSTFQTGNYQDWLGHLTSSTHQQEAKRKLFLRRKWEGEEGTYIMTGMSLAAEHIPWTNMELAQWLTTFGMVMEFFHDPAYHYVAFTLKDLALGMSKVHEVAKMHEFNGHAILIKLKSDYKYDWDKFFDIVDNRKEREFEERKQKRVNRELEKQKQPEELRNVTTRVMKGVSGASPVPENENIAKCLPATVSSTSTPSTFTSTRRNDTLTPTSAAKVTSEVFTPRTNASNEAMEPSSTIIRRKYKTVNAELSKRSTEKASPSSCKESEPAKAAEPAPGPSGVHHSSTASPESKDKRTVKKKKKKNSKRKNNVTQTQVQNRDLQPEDQSAPMKQQRFRSEIHNSSQFTQRELKTEVYNARTNVEQQIICSNNQIPVVKIPSTSSDLTACQIRGEPQPLQSIVGVNVPDALETLNFRGGFGSGIGRSRPASESSDLSLSQGANANANKIQRPVPAAPVSSSPQRVFHEHRNYVHGQSLEFRRSQPPQPHNPHSSIKYGESQRQQSQSSHNHPIPLMDQRPGFKNFGQRFPPSQNNAIPRDPKRHEIRRMGSGSSIEDQRSRRGAERQHTEVDSNRPRNSQEGNYSRLVNGRSDNDNSNIQHRPLYSGGVSDNRNVISSVLTGQIPPTIFPLLAHPWLKSRSRTQPCGDPYLLNQNHRTTSPSFELFQQLLFEERSPKKSKRDQDEMYKEFIKLDLTQQLQQFFGARTLTEEELRLRWQLILDISLILRQKYPTCELHPFGSILTGLGDSTSDIDIYVDFSREFVSDRSVDPKGQLSSINLLYLTKDALNYIGCPHRNRRFLSSLVPVTSAKVPILKLQHATTRIYCDLSFENRLSVQNTKLIRFFMNMDVKISKFMVLIRFWAKFHGLTGSNLIKNYALTLLVVVYLCKINLVPPVRLLQSMKAEEREYIHLSTNPNEIDGWDASFCDNITRINERFTPLPYPGTNSSPAPSEAIVLMKMAAEFFHMYATLDFSTIVVCPLLGDFLPRTKFRPGFESLPKSLHRYTNWAMGQPLSRRLNINAFLCLQDPFLLSYNVGSVTPQATLLKFQIACAKAAHILEQTGKLNSLLDVFSRLPNHIGNKKFMRVYKTERKAEELKEEIKTAILEKYFMDGKIEHASSFSSSASAAPQELQKSDYVVLPPHLRSLNSLMDDRSLKVADKKGKWETLIDFSLGPEFESIFVTELTLCKIQNDKRIAILGSLCELWREFTLDFMLDFFAKGLKLEILKKRDVAREDSLYMNHGRKYEDENQSRWSTKYLSKKEVESFDASPKTKFEADRLCKKILDLPQIRTPVHYEKLRVQVDHPFWENRSSTLAKVMKQMPEAEVINIPVLNQKEKKKDKRMSKTSKKGPQLDHEETGNLISYLRCFNPVTVQGRVSDKLKLQLQQKIDKEGKQFSSFWFDMLVKLDLSSTRSRPQLFILFEMDEAAKHQQIDFERAIQALSNVLEENLPTYLTFRLVKWLNLKHIPLSLPTSTSEKITDPPPSNSGETVNKSSIGGGKLVKEERRSGITTGKKKIRSKSDENLLIPSSSCDSSNSSEEDEGWGEETEVEEHEEEVVEDSVGKVKKGKGPTNDSENDQGSNVKKTDERREEKLKELEEQDNMAVDTEGKTKEKQKENGNENMGPVEDTEGKRQGYELVLANDKGDKSQEKEQRVAEAKEEKGRAAGEPEKEVQNPIERADEEPKKEVQDPDEKERPEAEPKGGDSKESGRSEETPKKEVQGPMEKEMAGEQLKKEDQNPEPEEESGKDKREKTNPVANEEAKEPEEDLVRDKGEKAKLAEQEKTKEPEEDLEKDKGEKAKLTEQEKTKEPEEDLEQDRGEKAKLGEIEKKAKEPEEDLERDKGKKAKLAEQEKTKEPEEDLEQDRGENAKLGEIEEKAKEPEGEVEKDKGEKAKEPEKEVENDKGVIVELETDAQHVGIEEKAKGEPKHVEKEEQGKTPEVEVERDTGETVKTETNVVPNSQGEEGKEH